MSESAPSIFPTVGQVLQCSSAQTRDGLLEGQEQAVADPYNEKHLHLQTTTVRMNSNIFGQKDSANQKVQSGLCTFKSAATSSGSRAIIILAKQPGYREVFCE